ncbi:hypothetical protein CMV_023767 [Castanea mollissima]|uniref:Peroxidase n=1 Tax=Castanea mollissima TaxID=60419 RepID=A0A8J4VIV6_9ROSI|nr:hypothetical protein CMV_023767 [Castanea mollissima]
MSTGTVALSVYCPAKTQEKGVDGMAYRVWLRAFFACVSVRFGSPSVCALRLRCPHHTGVGASFAFRSPALAPSVGASGGAGGSVPVDFVGSGYGLHTLIDHGGFATGCDASILLDSTPGNQAERDNPANKPSLRGFEVIFEAKAELEAQCPQTVSCADIVAFAARDSAYKVGGISYMVPSGRRDGRVSREDEATQNLPPPTFNAQQLEERFAQKGLGLDEMVTLSGAHSIGRSHCSSFSERLYNFNKTNLPDRSMDPIFARDLKTKCPKNANNGIDPTVPLDVLTPYRLDNKYYKNLKNHHGLLSSDQSLLSSTSTVEIVRNNARHGQAWAYKFGAAMIKMGYIDVLTGSQGEIRKNCRFVN